MARESSDCPSVSQLYQCQEEWLTGSVCPPSTAHPVLSSDPGSRGHAQGPRHLVLPAYRLLSTVYRPARFHPDPPLHLIG
jgi:hypothetical protein